MAHQQVTVQRRVTRPAARLCRFWEAGGKRDWPGPSLGTRSQVRSSHSSRLVELATSQQPLRDLGSLEHRAFSR
jgi:hypothetical protein